MHGHSLILLLFFFIGCNQEVKQSKFYVETSQRWMAATQISWISEYYKADEKILKPKGTWQPIMQINFIDQNFNEVNDCLFYYVPKEGDGGELKVIANRSNIECSELIGEEEYASIKGIINFGYEYDFSITRKENLILKVDTQRFVYNFLNMTQNQYAKEKLSSSMKLQKNIAATITSRVNYKVSFNGLKDGEICFDVADDCTELVSNKCNRCKYYSYQVIASKCKSKFRRICGMDQCGTKDQPACLRGYIAAGISSGNYCINGSPLGICQLGLKVVCVNGTLICE